ncbi:hypothetical protein BC830DRAFT_277226 [Chytriomyces sp. MP71]|nr:hypothetical protein BC830DRAFT_277226 [Chytriomyces sp. MP71]
MAATIDPSKGRHVKGKRYGEVTAAKMKGFTQVEVTVYSTFGLHDCPTELWSALTEADVKTATGCWQGMINGPRYWMIDYFGPSMAPVESVPISIKDLDFRVAGSLTLSITQVATLRGKYTLRTIPRAVEWIWAAGSMAYFLVSGNGDRFVCQSISQKVNPQLAVDGLDATLVHAELPKGWRFEREVLEVDLRIQTNPAVGHIVVIQDEFENSYVLVGDVPHFKGV